jgi:hypothetical protein
MSAPLAHDGLEIQPRDLAVLRCLLDSRVATVHHLSTLYFDGHLEAARKRMQKLKAAGIVHERPRRSTDPAIHCLTRKAFAVLQDHGILGQSPNVGWAHLEKRAHVSELTLKHELEIMDVRAAMTEALERNGYSVPEFSTWPKLYEFVARQAGGGMTLVKPDGFIRVLRSIHPNKWGDMFFLEVDRSTEEQQILADRASCYRDYYERGGLASRFGRPRSEFKQYPFVVLMTFKTAERRNNTAERLLLSHAPIRNQVWLTTLPEVMADPLGPIWVKPGDYARVTEGSAFDVQHRQDPTGYRRQPEREQFIDLHLQKHPLLPPQLEVREPGAVFE